MLAENPVTIKQEEKLQPQQQTRNEQGAKFVVKSEEDPAQPSKGSKLSAVSTDNSDQFSAEEFPTQMTNPFYYMGRNGAATSNMQNLFQHPSFQQQQQQLMNATRGNMKSCYPMAPFMMTPAQMFYGLNIRNNFSRFPNPMMMNRNMYMMPSTMTGMQTQQQQPAPVQPSVQKTANNNPVGVSSSVGYQRTNGKEVKASPGPSKGGLESVQGNLTQPLMSQQAVDAVIKEGNFNAQSVGAIFEKDVNSFKLRPENFKLLDLENKWIPTLQNELDIHDKEALNAKTNLTPDVAYKVFSYVIKYFGYLTYEEMSNELAICFTENSKSYNAFMALIERYQGVQKTKEENIKFVLRKAFKFMKDKVKGDCKDEKDAKRLFLEYYFNCPGISEEELESLIMPFTKKSQLKTMNLKYLKLIFSSPLFVKDYLSFLDYFDVITKSQNENKIKGACSNFLRFFKANNLEKIKKLRILPWLNSWINDTTKIAYYLMKYSSSPHMKLSCQVKYEFYINQNLQEKMKSFAPKNNELMWYSNLMSQVDKQRQAKFSVEEALKRKLKYMEDDCSGSSGYEQAESPEKISKRIKFESL